MNQKIYYHNKLLAYLLIAPQILIRFRLIMTVMVLGIPVILLILLRYHVSMDLPEIIHVVVIIYWVIYQLKT